MTGSSHMQETPTAGRWPRSKKISRLESIETGLQPGNFRIPIHWSSHGLAWKALEANPGLKPEVQEKVRNNCSPTTWLLLKWRISFKVMRQRMPNFPTESCANKDRCSNGRDYFS